MEKFKSVDELVNKLKPVDPIYCVRPKAIKKSVDFFKEIFLVKYYMLLKPTLTNSF